MCGTLKQHFLVASVAGGEAWELSQADPFQLEQPESLLCRLRLHHQLTRSTFEAVEAKSGFDVPDICISISNFSSFEALQDLRSMIHLSKTK